MANKIIKLEYRRECFDLEQLKIGRRIVTTIISDGTVICKEYKCGSRKVHAIKKTKCTLAAYRDLCLKIEKCIETADRHTFYVDDSSATLKVFYEFSLVLSMDRGIGNQYTDISCIMDEFLDKFIIIT